MKHIFGVITLVLFSGVYAQEAQEAKALQKQADNLVFEGNELLEDNDFISAEMEFRKAISTQSKNVAGPYNLGHIYYNNESYDEALYRNQQAAKKASSKEDRHKAFHNIGNILMQNDKCKEAVEAYKDALRNEPKDDETRYNLALAKECASNQDGGGESEKEDDNKDEQKDKEEEKKEEEEDSKDKNEEGEQDQKQGEEEEDENGKPKDEKNDDGKGEENKKPQQNKPQPGKLSAQQIKNILEAMNNQEQKVQEKINAKKQKGAKVKTEKDW